MATIDPYLGFDGNCEEAFNFYRSVFGGEFATLMRFKEAPPGAMPKDDSERERILHMALPIGKGNLLMGSDRPKSYPSSGKGDLFSVSVSADNEAEARKIYEGLSAGGKVTMPFEKSFWGSMFRMFTDEFGVQWIVSDTAPQP